MRIMRAHRNRLLLASIAAAAVLVSGGIAATTSDRSTAVGAQPALPAPDTSPAETLPVVEEDANAASTMVSEPAGHGLLFAEEDTSPEAVTASAKRRPPECNTAWKQYTPRKTFLWSKTSSWVLIEDALKVRFRSGGGEYYWRLDANCKQLKAWRAGASEYQEIALQYNSVPKVSEWKVSQENCRTTTQMNVIVACYRGELKTWKP